MMTAVQRKACERAFVAWDRASAFGCAGRGVPYNPAVARERWLVYCATLAVSGVNIAGLT